MKPLIDKTTNKPYQLGYKAKRSDKSPYTLSSHELKNSLWMLGYKDRHKIDYLP